MPQQNKIINRTVFAKYLIKWMPNTQNNLRSMSSSKLVVQREKSTEKSHTTWKISEEFVIFGVLNTALNLELISIVSLHLEILYKKLSLGKIFLSKYFDQRLIIGILCDQLLHIN